MTPLPFEQRVARRARALFRRYVGQARRRLRPPALPSRSDGRRLLHLGCGPVHAPGFIHVDLLPAPHVHVVTNLDDLNAFADGSVDLVYASHCLEHFGHHQSLDVLREWVRVLRPGGLLRVSVPDFQRISAAHAAGVPLEALNGFLFGQQDYPLNHHHVAFDEPMLRSLLERAGVEQVRTWDPATAPHHGFADSSSVALPDGTPVSLNLEGIKAACQSSP
jgi:predicted SAM-dependent methyltransferase